MSITVVAAVARNGVIGSDGAIPWHLPGEQRRFKETTIGHVLVMGRLTYESIGGPLPGRTTVVVSSQPDPSRRPGVHFAAGVVDALGLAAGLGDETFVVGGQRVYAEALPYVDVLLLTRVPADPEGDAYFPTVAWEEWAEAGHEEHEGWTLCRYVRAAAKPSDPL